MLEADSQVAEAEPWDDSGNRAPNGPVFATPEEREKVGLDPETGRFLPGNTVSRMGGRPKGSRNQLAEAFIADCYKDWQANGIKALEQAREQKPADYLKVIASILPKDIKVSLETMNDGELSRRIDELTKSLGLKVIDVTPASGDES